MIHPSPDGANGKGPRVFNPRALSVDVEDRIMRLRKTLTRKGIDAGAEKIAAPGGGR